MGNKSFYLLIFTIAVQAATISFSQDQWVIPTNGAVSDGCGGDYCLNVTGDGTGNDYFYSDSFSVNGSTDFFLEYFCTCSFEEGGSGVATAGLDGIATFDIDAGYEYATDGVAVGGGWRRYSYHIHLPVGTTSVQVHVGVWEVTGSCSFMNLTLTDSHKEYLTHSKAIGPLGTNEKIAVDGTYTATLASDSNYFRNMQSFVTFYNTNRYFLRANDYLLMKYAFNGSETVTLSGSSVYLKIGYYSAGTAVVNCSVDGFSWTRLGEISAVGEITEALPAAFNGAEHIYIKLFTEGTTPYLQLSDFKFESTISETPGTEIDGETVIVLSRSSPQYNTSVEFGPSDIHNIFEISNFSLLISTNGDDENVELSGKGGDRRTIVEFMAGNAFTLTSTPVHVRVGYILAATSTADTLYLGGETTEGGIIDVEVIFANGVNHLYDSTFGELLEEHSTFGGVWTCAGTYKVSKQRASPRKLGSDPGVVQIYSAANEYEAFQVIMRPDHSQINITNVQITDMAPIAMESSPYARNISSANFTVLQVGYVYIDNCTDDWSIEDFWPDPLLPLSYPVTCDADMNTPFYVKIYVPEGTECGNYSGAVKISGGSGGNEELVVNVKLTVFNFSIPRYPRLNSNFGLSHHRLMDYHHVANAENVWGEYLKDYGAHRLSPPNPLIFDDFYAEITDDEWVYHWSNFDANYAKYYFNGAYGFTGYQTTLPGLGGGSFYSHDFGTLNGYEWGTPEFLELFNAYAEEFAGHLDEVGLLNRTIVYWMDEPRPDDYDFTKEGMAAIKTASPELQRFLTVAITEELYGYVDVWCPPTAHFDAKLAKERQKEGEHVWWYLCCCPKEPNLGIFIDHHAIEQRLWLWMTFKYDVEGVLVWAANYWTSSDAYPSTLQDPYADPMSWQSGYGAAGQKIPWGNGDGRFLYPPFGYSDGLPRDFEKGVSSLRWEALLDGMEDWEYLTTLKEILETLKFPDEVTEYGQALVDVNSSIIEDLVTWTTDIEVLLERRIEIGKFISSSESLSIPSGSNLPKLGNCILAMLLLIFWFQNVI